MKRRKRPSRMSEPEFRRFLDDTIRTFYAIPLNGEFGFGRMVRDGDLACYAIKSPTIPSLDEIERAPVLSVVTVHFDEFVTGRWQEIGRRPVSGAADTPVKYFREDPITGFLDIYVEGEFQPYAGEDLTRMERLSVWNAEHIESRLKNHFAGRPDPSVEALKYERRKRNE
jgi:hypothetical protein